MARTFPARVRTVVESFPPGALSAVLVGAWLVLTALFTVAGVSLVGTVATAVGQPSGVVTFLVTLAGALGACAVAPTLARGVVGEAVERAAAFLDREGDSAPAGRLFGPDAVQERTNCRGSRGCCC